MVVSSSPVTCYQLAVLKQAPKKPWPLVNPNIIPSIRGLIFGCEAEILNRLLFSHLRSNKKTSRVRNSRPYYYLQYRNLLFYKKNYYINPFPDMIKVAQIQRIFSKSKTETLHFEPWFSLATKFLFESCMWLNSRLNSKFAEIFHTRH